MRFQAQKLTVKPTVATTRLRQAAAGLEVLGVEGEGGVAAAAGLAAGPLGAGDDRDRGGLGVGETDLLALVLGRQVRHLLAGPAFQGVEAGRGQAAVGGAGEQQDRLGGLDVGVQQRAPGGGARRGQAVELPQLRHLGADLELDALDRQAGALGQRAEGRHLGADRGVVAFDDGQRRHGLAGHGDGAVVPPVRDDAAGLRRLAGGVVLERGGHEVVAGVQVAARELGQLGGDGVEGREVRAGLPGRVDRRAEGVDIGVHVRGRQVVLLVPGRGRQHDVRHERRGRHAEVQRQQQVELAFRRLLDPAHLARPHALRRLGGAERGVGAQQVLGEVLGALGRGPE
jgi:antitoxin (DNA-binding transcriptional repressor) of toxin-antitoxin stability system